MDNNMQHLMMVLQNIGCQIGANNQLLLENVNQIMLKHQMENRKKRKKTTGYFLLAVGGLNLCAAKYFDDGSCDMVPISNRLTGKNTVYNLDFNGMEKIERFGIMFENEGVLIIGEKKRVKPTYLAECFVKSAGSFCPGLSRATIGNLLFDHWAADIEQTEQELRVPVLAGWDNGKFLHKGNFQFKKTTGFPDMPILHKEFITAELTDRNLGIYFLELQKIRRWRERILITLYPFASLLSSIFYEMHSEISFALNFVEIAHINRKIVCSWLKIFNRKTLIPPSINKNMPEINKLISHSRDEILIFDATKDDSLNGHFRRKIKQNVSHIIAGMKHSISITEENQLDPNFGCAFFSSERILDDGVINIIVDSEFYDDDGGNMAFIEYQSMEAVLTDFVSYVQNNLEIIWNEIRKKPPENEQIEHQFLYKTYGILRRYWSEKGIDFSNALKIQPEIKWDNFFDIFYYRDDDLIELFVESVRKEIRNLHSVEKRRNVEFNSSAFFYSEEYIWFPTLVMRFILKENGLFPYKNTILSILKEKKILITDPKGFSRKLQISGKSFEAYQIKRSLFDRGGMGDIVDLAKDIKGGRAS